MPNIKDLEASLLSRQKGKRLGCEAFCFDTCTSTNDKARELASKGAPDGTLVVSLAQTKGHGRYGRDWFTEKGGLALTLLLRPKLQASLSYRLAFLTASALMEGLGELGINTKLKWPNDLLVAKKDLSDISGPYGSFTKIAGILIELASVKGQADAIIVGIGINVSRPQKKDFSKKIEGVGFLDEVKDLTIPQVLFSTLDMLENTLAEPENDESFLFELNKVRQNCITLGHKVSVNEQGQTHNGLAVALNDDGSLSIEKSDGELVKIYAGDVHVSF